MSAKNVLVDRDHNNTARLMNLPAPAAPNDAARLADITSALEGLNFKDDARVATSSNINLASPGSSLDSIALTVGDRVLVRGQSTASQNGLYFWNGASSAMTRTTDCAVSADFNEAIASVRQGSDAGTTWRQTAVDPTVGSTSIAWTSFGVVAPPASESTAGIAEIATQAETDAGTDDLRMVTPFKLATWANRPLRYSTSIGDGSSTLFTITHNLGTRDVNVRVRQTATPYAEVEADVKAAATNTVTVEFNAAPTSNQYRVTVIA